MEHGQVEFLATRLILSHIMYRLPFASGIARKAIDPKP